MLEVIEDRRVVPEDLTERLGQFVDVTVVLVGNLTDWWVPGMC